MSEPIKEGDLVVVVKPTQCCGNTRPLGMIFRVKAIKPSRKAGMYCIYCLTTAPCYVVAWLPNDKVIEVDRIKRIPDFPELADERHDEEITA